jgi:hypothetical protein
MKNMQPVPVKALVICAVVSAALGVLLALVTG